MARPVIATKLYAARLRPGLVPRPRLRARLRRGAQSRLTLLSAPPGFGKTTLLAEWLAETADEKRSVAWLSLDVGDSAPASFWTGVVAALQTVVPGVGASAQEMVDSSPLPTLPTEHLVTTLLNDLVAVTHDVWLVLDDYHLADSREINTGLTFFLDHLPPQVHVVLSTRADPDLPLPRWRVRGELVEVRAADLRFTGEEAAAYLREVAGLDLTAADVTALEERTEGWIAALQLAALSMQGRADASGFVERFAGDDRFVVDYLVEEVLRQQTDPVREFLLCSAVLDRLSGSLADAVTGRDDGSAMLVSLERANLFLVPLDDHRQWYRYHHLFADVLRARLLAEQPELHPRLHLRASEWYETHGLAEEAIQHALAARDLDRAAYLMELAVPAIRRHRQEATMHGWLRSLPDDVVTRSPVLSVFFGSMLMASGDLDGVEPRLADAERALAAGPEGPSGPFGPSGSARRWADTDELHTLPATIAVYRASLAQARGDVAGTTEHARRALDLAGPKDHLARGAAGGFLGLAAWASGDVSTAVATFTQAVASLQAAGNLVDQLSSTVVLADMWLAAGRPDTARRLYERALQRAQAQGESVARASAELHVGLSEIDTEDGDLASARRHLETAADLADAGAMSEGRHRWFVAKGLLAAAEGDPEEAVTFLDQAEQLYRPGFFPDVRPIPAVRARVRIGQGRLSEAADWARDRGVSVTDESRYLSEFDHLTLVRLILAQDRAVPDSSAIDAAVGLLDRLAAAAETSGRAGSRLEIRVLQTQVHDAQIHRLPAPATRAPAPATTPPPAPATTPSLSGRELEVLRLLDSDLSGPQIARQLFVSHNTLRTHTKHIFTKLDVTTRRGAVSRARERGLL